MREKLAASKVGDLICVWMGEYVCLNGQIELSVVKGEMIIFLIFRRFLRIINGREREAFLGERLHF